MIATTYQDAGEFLFSTQAILERNEAANNLMLGTCLRLKRFPERIKTAPYLVTVADGSELVVAAVMTPPRKLVIHNDRQDCDKALELIARDLLANHWAVPGVLGPAPVAKAFAETWTSVSGLQYRDGMRQRIFELRKVIPPESSRGRLRLATEDDVDLVTDWILAFQKEALTGGDRAETYEIAKSRIGDRDIYIWEDQKPVSMAAKTRPMLNGIGVSLVYTPPELRGRGYATACVASLSQSLLDSGWKFCALLTDLSNPTSNRIYQRIGYTPVCDYNEYIFG